MYYLAPFMLFFAPEGMVSGGEYVIL
ncbi:hypothetical protein ROI_27310 [Roseburia intestinalis M50/1]|nr:hypothetical protein ROI_27310 [Roseburia intestinalis M50/1]